MAHSKYIDKFDNLIKEGKELVKERPLDANFDTSEVHVAESEAQCLKWFVKASYIIESAFGKDSRAYKVFVSLYKTFEWQNLLGTKHGEISFLQRDMLRQIAHLEALSDLLKDEVDIGANEELDKISDSPKSSAFVCHSSKDKEFAEKIARDLQGRGIDVWFDKWDLEIGHDLTVKIQEAIAENQFLIIILSPDAMASEWVKKEFNAALVREIEERRVVVLPLMYKECQLPPFLEMKKYADFRNPGKYAENIQDLARRIKGESNRPTKVPYFDPEVYKHNIKCRIRGNNTLAKGNMIKIERWFPQPDGPQIIKMRDLTSESEYSGDEPMMTVQATGTAIQGIVMGGLAYSGGETQFVLGVAEDEYKKYEEVLPKKNP